jgi:hypothetical protein
LWSVGGEARSCLFVGGSVLFHFLNLQAMVGGIAIPKHRNANYTGRDLLDKLQLPNPSDCPLSLLNSFRQTLM